SNLILTRDRTVLVSDARFTEQIADECPDLEVVIRPPTQFLHTATAGVLNQLGLRTLAFESSHLTVAEWETYRDLTKTLDWHGSPALVDRWRALKAPSEVAATREAIGFAERAFTVFRTLLRRSDREKDLCDAMEGYVRRVGGKCTSFPSIIAVGERAALPHAPPTDKAVAEA